MIGALFGVIASLVLSQPAHATLVAQQYLHTLPRAVDVKRPSPPIKKRLESYGVKTSSRSAFVADVATGQVLYAKDPYHVQPIASLTKLVTAMVFLDLKPNMKKTLTYEAIDFDHEGEAVFKPGVTVTYEAALRSMLVGSVNASAKAIARSTLGMDAFVVAMNKKVHELHLTSPVFVEPTGLDPRDRADAADVAAIITTASGYPEIRHLTRLPETTVVSLTTNDVFKIRSTNLLLGTYLNKKPYMIVTGKTGSLPEAGYCMAQVTRNAGGHEIVAVELGSDNHFARYQDIKALTTWAFDTYEWK